MTDLISIGSKDRGLLPAEANAPGGARLDFYNLSREELGALLASKVGGPTYRADQIFKWVYKKGIRDFSQMTDISVALRTFLENAFIFPEAEFSKREVSTDGSRKYLFSINSEQHVESVMIKQPNRMTLCVSSQVGCGMACTFCRTGTMGFIRNLSTSDIIRQVRGVLQDAQNFGDMFQNVVFMGMGEPLHNFENVVRALRIMRDQFAYDLSGRRITVSTVGLVPAIEKFGMSGVDVNLAVSLNATTDDVRSEIMPINKRYPISVLLDTLSRFPLKPRRKITFEYVMLAGINDTDADLARLPKLLHKIPAKINLIPYNDNAGLGYHSPPRERVARWQDRLTRAGLDTTVRWSKGRDINAACGQLATESQKIRRNMGESLNANANVQLSV